MVLHYVKVRQENHHFDSTMWKISSSKMRISQILKAMKKHHYPLDFPFKVRVNLQNLLLIQIH